VRLFGCVGLAAALASLILLHAASLAGAQDDGVAGPITEEVAGASGPAEAVGEPIGPLDKDPNGDEYVAGELIVSYTSDAAEKTAVRFISGAAEGRAVETLDEIDARVFSFDGLKRLDQDTRERVLETVRRQLEAAPGVEAVSYNHVMRQLWAPNDPLYGNGGQSYLGIVKAPAGWDYPNSRGVAANGRAVKIAVVDGGFAPKHTEFCTTWNHNTSACEGGKIAAQYDFVRDKPQAYDEKYHGSSVASVAAARTNNSAFMAGASPSARLIIAKVFDGQGNADVRTISRAIIWSANRGARVINLSFGDDVYDQGLKDALDYAFYEKNALPVCGTGNGSSDGVGDHVKFYPSAFPICLAVGASNGNSKSRFSNYGSHVDVVAPGENIKCALKWDGRYTYCNFSGTSYSTAIVSGLAANVISRNPSLSAAEVKATIEKYAEDLGPAGRDEYFGSGRVNFQKSIRYAPKQ
jgi:subtilisin family serine protease